MVYMCGSCQFLFFRVSPVERCPNCGKENIRPATPEEITRFERTAKPEPSASTT